jgi:hypothetical protein
VIDSIPEHHKKGATSTGEKNCMGLAKVGKHETISPPTLQLQLARHHVTFRYAGFHSSRRLLHQITKEGMIIT